MKPANPAVDNPLNFGYPSDPVRPMLWWKSAFVAFLVVFSFSFRAASARDDAATDCLNAIMTYLKGADTAIPLAPLLRQLKPGLIEFGLGPQELEEAIRFAERNNVLLTHAHQPNLRSILVPPGEVVADEEWLYCLEKIRSNSQLGVAWLVEPPVIVINQESIRYRCHYAAEVVYHELLHFMLKRYERDVRTLPQADHLYLLASRERWKAFEEILVRSLSSGSRKRRIGFGSTGEVSLDELDDFLVLASYISVTMVQPIEQLPPSAFFHHAKHFTNELADELKAGKTPRAKLCAISRKRYWDAWYKLNSPF